MFSPSPTFLGFRSPPAAETVVVVVAGKEQLHDGDNDDDEKDVADNSFCVSMIDDKLW